MNIKLPQSIEAYFQALNTYDGSLLASCFTEDAILYDEGLTYRGRTVISEHIVEVNDKLSVKTEVTKILERNGETIVTATLAGNFDGSPIPLDFHFTVKDQKITELNIDLSGEEA